jgi:chromate transporter
METILTLVAVFARIGLGAFGGGLAMIPFFHHELVASHPWLTETEFGEVVSLAQMTPGPIAINAATFVGYRLAGVAGSIAATAAVVGAPLLVLGTILWLFSRAHGKTKKAVDAIRAALRPAVAGLLLVALQTLARPLLFGAPVLWALLVACVLLSRVRVLASYPQLLILAAAVAGLLFLRP